MIIINNASYSNVSVTYTADGTQREFSFPFDYLRKAFVKVEVNEEIILVQGTDYTVSDNKTVVLTEAPESGTIVRVFRETSTQRLVSWADASVLRAKDMTIQQVQNLHILEEQQYWVTENAIIRQGKEWNARNFPIKNVGDPVDSKDATNKEYVDNNFMKLDDNGDYWVGRGKTITNAGEPTALQDAATKNYVDNLVAGVVAEGGNVVYFNNVAGLRAADVPSGMTVGTNGYATVNDGGDAIYTIRQRKETDVEDEDTVLLDNGLTAEKVVGNRHDDGAVFEVTNIARPPQDAVVYDGKMFYIYGWGGADYGNLRVMDIATGELLYDGYLDGGAKPHGNVVCFGKKQDPSDPYPLLYVTGYNGLDEDDNPLPQGVCYVYKVNADFSTTFVQKIEIGFINDDLWKSGYSETDYTANNYFPTSEGAIPYGDFIVDYDHDLLYVITVTGRYPVSRLFKFALPDTSSASVTLQTTDVIEYKNLPIYRWLQGACYYDNKLYVSFGNVYQSFPNACGVAIIDLIEKTQVGYIPHKNYFTEMETVFMWENALYIGGAPREKLLKVKKYKTLNNLGDIRDLRTKYNNNLVSAINNAKDTAFIVETPYLTDLAVKDIVIDVLSTVNTSDGILVMAVGAVPNIVAQIEAALYKSNIEFSSYLVHFKGLLRGANKAGGYFEIEGSYNTSNKTLGFNFYMNSSYTHGYRIYIPSTDTPSNYEIYSLTGSVFPASIINTTYPIKTRTATLAASTSYIIDMSFSDKYGAINIFGANGTNSVFGLILLRGTNEPVIKESGTVTGRFSATSVSDGVIKLTLETSTHLAITGTAIFAISKATN